MRSRSLNGEIVLYGVETRGDSVVRVDNSIVNILENVGELSGFNLFEGDVLGVVLNVSYGCGDAGAVFELDDALLLKKKKRTCLIGSVVGNGNGDALAARRAGGEAKMQPSARTAARMIDIVFFMLIISFVF